MEPIFDFSAATVGWLNDDLVVSAAGRPVAFLIERSVFAGKTGHYLGEFEDGMFRDRLGCIVAFIGEALRYGVLPVPDKSGLPPTVTSHQVPGRACHVGVPPYTAKPLLGQSSLDWDRFMRESEAKSPWETRL